MPILEILGATLPFVASGINSALNFGAQQQNQQIMAQTARENVDKTIRANREMAEYQYNKNLEQWRRENQYNTPAEQMLRLKAAGLNPMLAYGVGNQAGASPSYQAPQQNYAYQPVLKPDINLNAGVMQQSIAAYQDLQLKKSQIDNVKANTDATKQQTANSAIQGALLAIESLYKERKEAAGTSEQETRASFAARKEVAELILKSLQSASTAQQTEQSASLFPYDLAFKRGSIAQQSASTREILERLKAYPAQREKLAAEIQNIAASTSQTSEKTKSERLQQILLDKEALLKQYQIWLRQHNTYEGDTPWGKGTRDFSIFVKWLTNKFN